MNTNEPTVLLISHTPAAPRIALPGWAFERPAGTEVIVVSTPNGKTWITEPDDRLHMLAAAVLDASPKGDVPRADVVPGVMRCAKCSLQLHRTNLYMGSGTTGPGDSKTEPCPNGCGPLWPVTWQTWATEGWEQAERYHDELRQLQNSPKGGSDGWQSMDTAPKSVADGSRIDGIYLLGFIPDDDLVDPQAAIDVIWWEPLLPNSSGGRGKWCANRYGEALEVVPTKWQHLPAARPTSHGAGCLKAIKTKKGNN